MRRYFFAVVHSDQEIADPVGTILPDDDAAAEYAERLLAGLRAERPPELLVSIIVNKRPNSG